MWVFIFFLQGWPLYYQYNMLIIICVNNVFIHISQNFQQMIHWNTITSRIYSHNSYIYVSYIYDNFSVIQRNGTRGYLRKAFLYSSTITFNKQNNYFLLVILPWQCNKIGNSISVDEDNSRNLLNKTHSVLKNYLTKRCALPITKFKFEKYCTSNPYNVF